MSATAHSEPPTYEVCGLRLRSEVALAAPALDVATHDVDVTLGPSAAPEYQRPTTDVVAEEFYQGWARFSFCRSGDDYVARFYSLADFDIAGDLRHVHCRPDSRADPDLVPILVCGGVVAFLLMAAGRTVLHASAVEVGQTAIAFAGPSGTGKSTLGALLCATGARLVTDDCLPLSVDGDGVRCGGGTRELRLREGATGLVRQFSVAPRTRQTADQRMAVSPPLRQSARPPLAAIVLPLPERGSPTLGVNVLPTAQAAHRLAQCFRIGGWRRPEDLSRTFGLAVELAQRVPVLEMRVPWGPPFALGLADDIIAAALAASSASASGT